MHRSMMLPRGFFVHLFTVKGDDDPESDHIQVDMRTDEEAAAAAAGGGVQSFCCLTYVRADA